jgi:hypothetical protein
MAGVVVRRYAGGGVWIGDSQAAARPDMRPPKTEEEVDALMGSMGRDAASGARTAARSAVDYGDSQPQPSSGASGGGQTGSGYEADPIR